MKRLFTTLCFFLASNMYAMESSHRMEFEKIQRILTDAMERKFITPQEIGEIKSAIPNVSPENLEKLIILTNDRLKELHDREGRLQLFQEGASSYTQEQTEVALTHNSKEIERYSSILASLVIK